MKKELNGPSLTVKWASASSFFIFVVFTIFAVLTYNLCVNLIVKRERENAENVLIQVVNRLSKSAKDLTVTSVYEQLRTPTVEEDYGDNKKLTVKGSLLEVDTMFSELNQPELFLSIYDTEGVLIFETKESKSKLLQKKKTKNNHQDYRWNNWIFDYSTNCL